MHQHRYRFIVVSILFAIFLALTVLIIFRATDALEMPVVIAAIQWRAPVLTALLLPITFVTSAIPTAALCLVASARRLRQLRPQRWREWGSAAWPIAAFLTAAVINITLRLAIGRLRPSVAYIDSSLLEIQAAYQRYSFPSGHATSAVIVFGALLALVRPNSRRRTTVLVAALALVISTGIGRVYLGVHWPTDVIGGYLLGATCVCLFHQDAIL